MFKIAVLLLGVVIAQAHYLPKTHHHHHASNELDHGEDYLWDDSHEDQHQKKWNGPIHVPVIENGVPTETPEVRHAKAHLHQKLAEADKHYHHHHEEEENKWSNHGRHYHVEEHHNEYHHHQPKWTGPVHVPVIEHGVPTETPEVRHAKAHLFNKHAEAKSHPDFHHHEEEKHESHYVAPVHHAHAKPHHAHQEFHHEQHRWTGPVHVPVLEHGVPTETPEVRHAKAHLLKKHAEAKSHPNFQEFNHHGEERYFHEENHHNQHNQHRWSGPVHVPVLEHGVPTETPEVRHAKAHLLQKHAEAKSHPNFQEFKHTEEEQYFHEENHHNQHNQHRWSGPVHVPVIEHGVPTETPEVRHAKAHLYRKYAEAVAHPEFNHHEEEEEHRHHFSAPVQHHHHHHHQVAHHEEQNHHGHRWTGPIHVPVIEHGVPTETPEVLKAKAHLHAKLEEAKFHAGPEDYEEDNHHAAKFVKASKGHHFAHGAHKSHY
ncbi:hypothetical protein DMENIID0001_040190 [Sergentomyia squamirostris]